jgi:lipopolysaccharide/colanic/teichoic acid biosynthesis glycosyltransferase
VGYYPADPALSTKETVEVSYSDRIIALLLLILLSPLFAVTYVIVRLTLGSPVFYTGQRMGLHKRPFNIIKFRTLAVDAEKCIGGQLVSERQDALPLVSRFLRDSRLDELPQLVNVVRGEMALVGPRPEREEVYRQQCSDIPGYEERFRVPPGLIGLSQLCTPHSTPKSFRARIDRRCAVGSRKVGFVFLLYAAWMLIRRLFNSIRRYLWGAALRNRFLHRHVERQKELRVRPRGATVEVLADENGEIVASGEIRDMNRFYMRVHLDSRLEQGRGYHCRIRNQPSRCLRGRIKTAHCVARPIREVPKGDSEGMDYVLAYEPSSPLNNYLIHQYFLHESIIGCPD